MMECTAAEAQQYTISDIILPKYRLEDKWTAETLPLEVDSTVYVMCGHARKKDSAQGAKVLFHLVYEATVVRVNKLNVRVKYKDDCTACVKKADVLPGELPEGYRVLEQSIIPESESTLAHEGEHSLSDKESGSDRSASGDLDTEGEDPSARPPKRKMRCAPRRKTVTDVDMAEIAKQVQEEGRKVTS